MFLVLEHKRVIVLQIKLGCEQEGGLHEGLQVDILGGGVLGFGEGVFLPVEACLVHGIKDFTLLV